ncbi:hypothetical protein CAQU_00625 [Corynebacterium aquilae DSM 44791]|uniref:Tail specific protease domain-containing protein n=1 Tax=Corynebacterium aquilae DSM 44791 TaxID=1431546 RepID=A0A1L7CDC2_9CORY|nr:hypothetical protein CAQU_00625 [Corynebacterium aquilae DSM 44791]
MGCGSIFAVTGVILAGLGYVYGPAITAMTTGQPRYVIKPSPQKYAADVLRIADYMAIDSDSENYARVKEEIKPRIKSASSYEDLYEPLNQAMKAAGGKHSSFLPPEKTEPSTAENSVAPTVESSGNIGIVRLPSLGKGEFGQTYADIVTQGLLEHAQCGAIVDLRGNDGGDMGPMVAGVSPLLPDGVLLRFVGGAFTSTVNLTGNSVSGGGSPTATSGGKRDVPVAILTDGDTASSAEATLLAFRGLDNTRSFGTPTAGYASANSLILMPDRGGIQLTVANDEARTGEVFSDDPIPPDELVDGDPAQVEKAALAWLASTGCTPAPHD